MIKKGIIQSNSFQVNHEMNVSLKNFLRKEIDFDLEKNIFLFFSPSWGFRTIFTLRAEGKEENDIKLVH